MKYIKSILKVALVFLGIIVMLALALFFDRTLTESRADNFCQSAVEEKNLSDVQALLSVKKGVSHSVFFENVATIQFSLWTGERYVCIVEFDDNGKPSSSEVVYKD